jgi:hypothetical protein
MTVPKRFLHAAYLLLGVDPKEIHDVMDVHISRGNVTITLICRNSDGSMIVAKDPGTGKPTGAALRQVQETVGDDCDD